MGAALNLNRFWKFASGHVGACISLAGVVGAAASAVVIYFVDHEGDHRLQDHRLGELEEQFETHLEKQDEFLDRLEAAVEKIEG